MLNHHCKTTTQSQQLIQPKVYNPQPVQHNTSANWAQLVTFYPCLRAALEPCEQSAPAEPPSPSSLVSLATSRYQSAPTNTQNSGAQAHLRSKRSCWGCAAPLMTRTSRWLCCAAPHTRRDCTARSSQSNASNDRRERHFQQQPKFTVTLI